MDARTGPKIRTGPDKLRGPDFSVRIFLVRSVVRIFRSGFFWSGPWSGFFGPDIFGPVRGPDNAVRISNGPVRVRIFGPDNPYRSGLSGPVRTWSGFLKNKKIRTGPNLNSIFSVRSGFSEK